MCIVCDLTRLFVVILNKRGLVVMYCVMSYGFFCVFVFVNVCVCFSQCVCVLCL